MQLKQPQYAHKQEDNSRRGFVRLPSRLSRVNGSLAAPPAAPEAGEGPAPAASTLPPPPSASTGASSGVAHPGGGHLLGRHAQPPTERRASAGGKSSGLQPAASLPASCSALKIKGPLAGAAPLSRSRSSASDLIAAAGSLEAGVGAGRSLAGELRARPACAADKEEAVVPVEELSEAKVGGPAADHAQH